MSARTLDPTQLEIHTQETHRPAGVVDEAHFVPCPRRGTLRAEECLCCVRLVGMHVYDDPERFGISCYAHEGGEAITDEPTLRSPISAIMTRTVRAVSPGLELARAADLMLEFGISSLPVVDGDGRAIGLVTKTDVLRAAREDGGLPRRDAGETEELRARGLEPGFHVEKNDATLVSEVMSAIEFAIPERATIGEAAALMALERAHSATIQNADGLVVGIVSSLDVLRFVGRLAGHLPHP